jgi:hypothetical protein
LLTGFSSNEILQNKIMDLLLCNANRYNIKLVEKELSIVLRNLIYNIYTVTSRDVVIIIDEFDAPIYNTKDLYLINHFNNIFSSLYSIIKSSSMYTDQIFIAGRSKFNTSIFNRILQCGDITLQTEFGNMLGFTQDELLTYFPLYIEDAAKKLKLSEDDLLIKLQDKYEGFSFDGVSKLYNPFSIINFFAKNKIDDYWMKTESKSRILRQLKHTGFTPFDYIDRNYISFNFSHDYFEPISNNSFLYSEGCLSLKLLEKTDYLSPKLYSLDYSAQEVKNLLFKIFLNNYLREKNNYILAKKMLSSSLANRNILEIVNSINFLYSSIDKKEFKFHKDPTGIIKFYVGSLYVYLLNVNIDLISENHINYFNFLFNFNFQYYYIELNFVNHDLKLRNAAKNSFIEILNFSFDPLYQNSIKISLAINIEKRQIGYCFYKIDDQILEIDLIDPNTEIKLADIA